MLKKILDENILFIGDAEGRLKEILRLIKRYPNYKYILVGDLQDRGSQSKQLINYLIENKNIICLFGNHEELFIEFVESEFSHSWSNFLTNGGVETLISYTPLKNRKLILKYKNRIISILENFYTSEEWLNDKVNIETSNYFIDNEREFLRLIDIISSSKKHILKKHINFIKSLPRIVEGNDWVCSHAPIRLNDLTKENILSSNFLWNRGNPTQKNKHQIYGHNGYRKKELYSNGFFVYCVDDTGNQRVNALNWKTKRFVSEKIIN
jgi:hypothetical protein